MAEGNGKNGKGFSIVVGILSTIMIAVLSGLVYGMIDNENKSMDRYEKNRDRIELLLKENGSQHLIIMQSLMELQTLMKVSIDKK